MTHNTASIRDEWVDVHGWPIHYRRGGDGGSRVLLIHGGGSDHSGFAWKYVLPELSRHHQVVAVDLPGYGESRRPREGHSPQAFSELLHDPLPFHIRFIGEFLRAIDWPSAALVGLSMGGGIALGVTLQYPELVERLVLVSSYGLGRWSRWCLLTPLVVGIPGFDRQLRRRLCRSPRLIEWGLRRLFRNRRAITPELVQEVREMICRYGEHPAWGAFLRREVRRWGFRTHFLAHLSRIQVPTLLIHGKQDPLIPVAWARRAHRQIAGSRLGLLSHCGHVPPLEYPKEVTEFILGESGRRR